MDSRQLFGGEIALELENRRPRGCCEENRLQVARRARTVSQISRMIDDSTVDANVEAIHVCNAYKTVLQ